MFLNSRFLFKNNRITLFVLEGINLLTNSAQRALSNILQILCAIRSNYIAKIGACLRKAWNKTVGLSRNSRLPAVSLNSATN